MKHSALLSLLLALGCMHVHGAPVEPGALEELSCDDAQAKFVAGVALSKLNNDRQEGYVLALHGVRNAHIQRHGETGVVFYLTLDVLETNCSVLSKRDWKTCETRPTENTPVYGQCKVAIYINRPQRVTRLYKYSCEIRPVPAARVSEICPDCPSLAKTDDPEVQKLLTLSLEKFNKEGGLEKRFTILKVSRATSGLSVGMYYNVEYAIQETTCSKTADGTDCPLMTCEFAHKGFCKASIYPTPTGESEVSVACEIFEPEAAEREKKLHDKADQTDHAHTDGAGHDHSHDHAHAADSAHPHDHSTDHTVPHGHHHHSHGHGHGDQHFHKHHAAAHNHEGDFPGQHHTYQHAPGVHTHEHDHEHALDHDHKHPHLHHHEHHHHHHEHHHGSHEHPEGTVRTLPALGKPITLPSFPDVPVAGPEVGVTLPAKPDPEVPGTSEPFIEAFPATNSSQCTARTAGDPLVEKVFSEDSLFQ